MKKQPHVSLVCLCAFWEEVNGAGEKNSTCEDYFGSVGACDSAACCASVCDLFLGAIRVTGISLWQVNDDLWYFSVGFPHACYPCDKDTLSFGAPAFFILISASRRRPSAVCGQSSKLPNCISRRQPRLAFSFWLWMRQTDHFIKWQPYLLRPDVHSADEQVIIRTGS